MNYEEVQEKIKKKRKELNNLLKLAKSMNKKEMSYEKAASIAERINAFYYCKDLELKKKIFFNDTIYLAQKNKNHIFQFEEMHQLLNNVQNTLKQYKGEILINDAECEFLTYYGLIEMNDGIENILQMQNSIKFHEYKGKSNYISKLYERYKND